MGLLCCGLTQADFMATSQSAVYDPADGLVTFNVTFNEAPDFYTADSLGRQAMDFQYYIIGDASLDYPADYDAIVRGGEIYLGGGIPIRNALPADLTDPNAGGWGAIRGSASFTLVGTDFTFSVPLSVLSDHSTNGQFSYVFQTDVYGAQTHFLANQQSAVLPEPATAALASLSLLGVALIRAVRARQGFGRSVLFTAISRRAG
jgi:hypothetical protein